MAVKKELVDFLHTFHNVTMPNLMAKGYKPTPTNAREAYANLTKNMVTEIIDLPQIYDDLVPAQEYFVPVRIYNPNPSEELPVLMNFHGGGYMVGSVTVYDSLSRKLAAKTNHIVVAVDYRLTPECAYPAGHTDCYNATKNIWAVLDSRGIKYKKEISISGDSAGGGLCAYIAARIQHEQGFQVKSQILIYPDLDFTMSTESTKELGENHFLTGFRRRFYYDNLFQNCENRYDASPLYGLFTKNIPPTLVITAGYDPLKDEGKIYAEKVKAAGAYAEYICIENMIHAFMNIAALTKEECEIVYNKINEFLHSKF